MAAVHDKYLVKMEKALSLYVEDVNRKRVPIDSNVFITPKCFELV